MGVGRFINGVYQKAKGAAEFASGNQVKGMQTFDEGVEKTSNEMARLYETAQMDIYPGSREAMGYVDDAISQKAFDVGYFVGDKYKKVKDFFSW